jgi:hypothetical protein
MPRIRSDSPLDSTHYIVTAGHRADTEHRDAYQRIGRAGRNLGIVLLGAAVMAMLALPQQSRSRDIDHDTAGEEVPLFI